MNNLRLHQPVAVGGLMVLPSLCVTFYFRAVSIFPHNQPHAASWAPWLLFRFISRLTQFLLHCLHYFFLVLTFNRQAAFPSRSPSSLIQSCTKLSSVFHNLVVQWLAYYSTIVVLRLVHGVSAVVPPASSSSSLQSYFCFFFVYMGWGFKFHIFTFIEMLPQLCRKAAVAMGKLPASGGGLICHWAGSGRYFPLFIFHLHLLSILSTSKPQVVHYPTQHVWSHRATNFTTH